ncbi:NAD-dependent epimerase/dehydratase family protein [Rhizobium sp. C1]|uniref:NAD-dependent epimerase/dehydratase family protein n=1 Tax=Rhizobium sp. C1 TaxID=1349799 RepID=UPI001E58EE99|nr:NAD(P)-dependent oxidoreductase [Rhizobium sp. C1]MCD2178876.1 NAD(P)-dependent oxidoreductase [Rhizobium sp. C1]
MTKVFLTGASGFVGRQILRHLVTAGHEVTVAVRPGSMLRAGLSAGDVNVMLTRDLFAEREDWWKRALEGQDTLIHAAWYVDPKTYQRSRFNFICTAGSIVMARAAAQAGVRHVIGLGTCMEYRLPSTRIQHDAPLGPSTLYSAAKLATCFALQRHAALAGQRFTWCRLFYLHGEAEQAGRLAPYIHDCIARGEHAHLSAGTQLRDYLDVADAGRMIAAITDTRQEGVVNICSGRPTTIRLFAERIADTYGRRDLLIFSSNPVPASDPAAVVGVCNWQAPQ